MPSFIHISSNEFPHKHPPVLLYYLEVLRPRMTAARLMRLYPLC